MSSPVIAVVGLGNIGGRHVQSLGQLNREVSIYGVDPVQETHSTSLALYQSNLNKISKSISFCESFEDLPKEIDIVILAVTSDIRRAVLENLLKICQIKYLILEKVLFQNIEDFHKVHELLSELKVKAWVNCPTRLWPGYQNIKQKIPNTPIHVNVSSSNFGIGCNSIHYIDLLNFFTGDQNIIVDTSLLHKKVYPSKRKDFIEFMGTLRITTTNGSTLTITSYPEPDIAPIVYIEAKSVKYVTWEHSNRMMKADSTSEWKFQDQPFEFLHVSQQTYHIIHQILDNGNSDLSSYDLSMKLHIPMIDSFIKFLNSIGVKTQIAPIT